LFHCGVVPGRAGDAALGALAFFTGCLRACLVKVRVINLFGVFWRTRTTYLY
jgi:hypothetical protein